MKMFYRIVPGLIVIAAGAVVCWFAYSILAHSVDFMSITLAISCSVLGFGLVVLGVGIIKGYDIIDMIRNIRAGL